MSRIKSSGRRFGLFLTALLISGHVLLFADASSSLMDDRRQVLQYGLDSEVLELVQTLYQEKNTQFLPELISLFSQSQNSEVRQNVLSLFLELKNKSLLKPCETLLSNPDQISNSLLLTAVSYLTELDDTASITTFASLVKNQNKTLAVASIRALGKLKATEQTQLLLDLLKNPETDDNFKPDIYWSLGEMQAVKAVPDLNKAFDATDSDPLTQQVIVESLGKIGDPSSWDRIHKAFGAATTSLKAKALEAMVSYAAQHPEVNQIVGAGLRDSQSGVRLAAAAAEKKLKDVEWKDLLIYRLKKDPDAKVRLACAAALASFPDNVWQPLFLEVLKDGKADFEAWKIVLDLCLEKKFQGAGAALKEIISQENQDKIDTYTPTVALDLLSHRDVQNRELYGLLLLNDKASTRMLALRAISADGDKTFADVVKKVATTDDDGAVRDLASSILRSWGVSP